MKRSLKWMRLSSLGLLALLSTQVYASGFKLEFQSPSVLADAGDAAVVEDAGTNWYNSAGLVYIPRQAVFGGMHVYTRTKFSGTAFAPNILGAGPPFVATGSATYYGNPNLPLYHLAWPIMDCYAIGLSVVPSWGLMQDYGPRSLVRYDLDRIYTRTLQISPSIAWKINSQWSIGGGLDFHYLYLSSKTNVRTQPITQFDSISRVAASDWTYGAHFGVLYRLNDCTRFGLNYRSRMTNHLTGWSNFTFFPGPVFETDDFKLNFRIPSVTSFSAYHDINPTWAIMGTVTYENWSIIRNLVGQNFMGPNGVVSDVTIPQHFRNTWDFGLGTHYKWSECLLLRASVKYLQTPTINSFRDLNFPDGEKLGFNFGARIQLTKSMMADVLYAHVFIRDQNINVTNAFGANVNGNVRNAIDIAGAQLVWNI